MTVARRIEKLSADVTDQLQDDILVNKCVALLYPPQRGYIKFVNTFVTPRNNNLRPYIPWRQNPNTFELCLSVRPSVRLW